jgi:formylglycine-generating enzyme required for sulfatase activity
MMKLNSFRAVAVLSLVSLMPGRAAAQDHTPPFISETPQEFFGSGDFDGDGRMDLVIVDKESGKYRLGYQTSDGVFNWVDCRPSGLKPLSGFSIGRLLNTNHDALVLSSPDANQINLLEVSSASAPNKPIPVPFTAALGPNLVVALDIGGPGHSSLADLFVGTIYNAPDPNQATLVRNDGSQFPKLADLALAGPANRGNRLAFKNGGPELLCVLVTEEKGDTFRAEDVSTGKLVSVAALSGLPAGSDYVVGNFQRLPLRELVFYKPGENYLMVRPVEEPAPGKLEFGKGDKFDLSQAVKRVVTLGPAPSQRLLILLGDGKQAGIYDFDGVKAPVLTQSLNATNDVFTCAQSLPDGFIIYSEPSSGKFSTKYQIFKTSSAKYVAGAWGSLASLADNDNITIPDIYSRVEANTKVAQEADMKPYTNTIPGTRVSFAMVPIPGGEFLMGSPDNQPNRKPDEGPQHKVKISPFWMGQCEVTWNEYELFMYPDEERRMRGMIPSDEAGDKLGDAVTHPSKPYVEMSFGMGKDGFPAIAMTQHAANKYCQWLSAKTGQFFRLPTEAEWEYACRAGTTTTYFFGDDASQLGQYAWFEQNSDFKYQKVGKKKPNPWGLYDIYGNVVEWVLDQYDPDYYKKCAAQGEVVDPWNKAAKPYPLAVRGGSWDDEASMCRSDARRGSDRSWKMQDPQLPKSVWYFSDAQWIGFRLVRPLKVPPPEEMQKYWTSGVERD